jgi:hypothetical protein
MGGQWGWPRPPLVSAGALWYSLICVLYLSEAREEHGKRRRAGSSLGWRNHAPRLDGRAGMARGERRHDRGSRHTRSLVVAADTAWSEEARSSRAGASPRCVGVQACAGHPLLHAEPCGRGQEYSQGGRHYGESGHDGIYSTLYRGGRLLSAVGF